MTPSSTTIPVDNCVDKGNIRWIGGGELVGSHSTGVGHHHPHCGHLLLRDRGWLWMDFTLSTLFVDSPVDASWKAWIASLMYPQPSTFLGDIIPHLPRTHPQRARRKDRRSTPAIAEFKGDIA